MKPTLAPALLLLAALGACGKQDTPAPSDLRAPTDAVPMKAPAPEVPPSATPGPDAGSALDQAGKAADAARRAVAPTPK